MALSENPNLALIPSGYKAGKIYSVLPTNGVGDFNFARGSVATRINSSGLIEEVASNVPRLNYPLIDGVVKGCPHHILEPERRQLIQYSEDFSNAAWQKISTGIDTSIGTNGINPNVAISPDGTLNADRVNFILQADRDAGMYELFAASQNNTYSTSVFLKGEGSNVGKKISIRVKRLTGGVFTSVEFDYILTENWFRLELDPLTMPSGSTNGIIIFTSSEATSCLIYGCQIEQGSYPTSYIPNYGTAAGVTRSAETANGSGDASTFNDSEGVLMVEMSRKEGNTSTSSLSLNDGTISNSVTLYYYQSNKLYFDIFSGVTTVTGFIDNVDTSNLNKIALKYKTGNISFFLNGFELATKTNAISLSGLSEIKLNYGEGSYPLNGSAKQIQYYDTALTDSELEQLTSWVSFTDMAESQLYSIE